MTWDLASLIFLVLLLAYFVNALYRRRQGASRPGPQSSPPPARGRDAPESNAQWQGNSAPWDEAIAEAESGLKAAKEKLATAQVDTLPYEAFADPATRKSAAMRYLNARRGRQVRLIASSGAVLQGEVLTLTADQVLLRGADGQVQGLALAEIEKGAQL